MVDTKKEYRYTFIDISLLNNKRRDIPVSSFIIQPTILIHAAWGTLILSLNIPPFFL